MKINKLILASTICAIALTLNSCKKANVTDDLETTFELSANQAISDNLAEDAHDVFMEVAVDNNVAGNFGPADPVISNNIIPCATVTITPQSGFPKTIVIDFGTGCTANGITRSGIMQIVISDSVRRTNSTAVMTFNNYHVNGFKIEGKITWTNTSAGGTRSWTRLTEDGKITAPGGRFWLHTGLRTVVQTAGVNTPFNLLDDVFSITGSHTVTNSGGNSRECTVLEALQKKTACANIDKGKLKVQGPNHYAIIDYGNGVCDNLATISIDGRPPRTIILR